MNATLTEAVLNATRQAERAPHGHKQAILKDAADWLGVSLQHFYRLQDEVMPLGRRRKRRADAGQFALSRYEAKLLCTYLMAPTRNNGKRLPSLKDAVETLRANGEVLAGQVDPETGEFEPLSLSAIGRAMRAYRLHPDILQRARPAIHLRSKHPNHVWEIDPSLCVLYYLPTQQGECLQVMSEKVFYKNKPANIRRIEKERVWRYVITDHASGTIYVHYVLGAESGRNLVDAFIAATQKSDHPADPFCGIPQMVMVDPGSANTGAVFKNLCHSLGIHLQVNEPGQPRAKGQVEKANDMVERSFEHRLTFLKTTPTSLEEINALAWKWMRHFNATEKHRRTGRTRYDVWMTITEEQLQLAPTPEQMRALSIHKPETRKVDGHLEISYRGRTYSVAEIPEVMVGEKVTVTHDAYSEEACQVIYRDGDVQCQKKLLPIQRDELGFFENGAVIGEEYKAHKDTLADTHRKELERFAMDAATDDEAAAKRRAKVTPMGGRIDPMKPMDDTPLPSYLPKRGTEFQQTLPGVESATLNLVDAARALSALMGRDWKPDYFAWLQQRHPNGVTEDSLPTLAVQLRGGATPLQSVQGGEA